MPDINRKFKTLKVKSTDSETHDFEGYLSTYGNTDRDGDVFVKGCFDDSLAIRTTFPMLYGHDYQNVDNALGALELSSDDKGLFVKGTFGHSEKAQHLKELIQMGGITNMSVGCFIQDYEPVDRERPLAGSRVLKADIVEGSIVPVPANPAASVAFVKSLFDGGDEADAERVLQELIAEGVQKALSEEIVKAKTSRREAIAKKLEGLN